MKTNKIKKLPLTDDKDLLKGLITSNDLLLYKKLSNVATFNSQGQLVCGAAVGVKAEDYLERTKQLVNNGIDFICIDVAHGHHLMVSSAIKVIKNIFPQLLIMAGNVCTKEGAIFLIEAGANAIKVGVGNGSICSTRGNTGCGLPQLSAVSECVSAAMGFNIPVIADGGHSGKIGNIFKALAIGKASASMLGRLLAGTNESPGDVIIRDGKKVKVIRGMASYTANRNDNKGANNVEGIEGIVQFKGEVEAVLDTIREGIQSGMSYVGCDSIEKLRKTNVRFTMLTDSGKKESGYHDITVL